jgi:hypothetical protein
VVPPLGAREMSDLRALVQEAPLGPAAPSGNIYYPANKIKTRAPGRTQKKYARLDPVYSTELSLNFSRYRTEF